MTYEEALSILRNFLHFLVPSARANGKTMMAYKRFEAFCKAIEALEKQIPKKPYDTVHCPLCKIEVELQPIDVEQVTYCLHCGQAIDWSDDE